MARPMARHLIFLLFFLRKPEEFAKDFATPPEKWARNLAKIGKKRG